jgi:hypothetical protein
LGPLFLFEYIEAVVSVFEANHCQSIHHKEVDAYVVHPMVQRGTEGLVLKVSVDGETVTQCCTATLEDNRRVAFLNARLRDEDKDKEKGEHCVDRVTQRNVLEDGSLIAHLESFATIDEALVKKVVNEESLSLVNSAVHQHAVKFALINNVCVALLEVQRQLRCKLFSRDSIQFFLVSFHFE